MTETASETGRPRARRHGCLTAYLILIIVMNSLVALFYAIDLSHSPRWTLKTVPDWGIYALIGIGVVNLLCAVALFRWSRWGFWGFSATALATFVLNLSFGIDWLRAAIGLLGVVFLFIVLQIGKPRNGWSQLR